MLLFWIYSRAKWFDFSSLYLQSRGSTVSCQQRLPWKTQTLFDLHFFHAPCNESLGIVHKSRDGGRGGFYFFFRKKRHENGGDYFKPTKSDFDIFEFWVLHFPHEFSCCISPEFSKPDLLYCSRKISWFLSWFSL